MAAVETRYPEKLDDILALPVGQMVEALEAWRNVFDGKHFGHVLIKSNDGKPMAVSYRGETFNIPPKGRRIDRNTAQDLLLKFGKNGVYHGMDRATGMTEGRWMSMPPTEKERFKDVEFKFQKQYLTHIPDTEADDNNEAEEAPGTE